MRTLMLALVFLVAVGCDGGGDGGGGGGGDTGGGEDVIGGEDSVAPDGAGEDGSSDTTPPEFRDVRVEIHAEPSIPLDLNNQDVERVLPMAFPATFTVFTTDDVSTADAITVTILLGDGDTLVEGQVAAFSNGLWTVEVPEIAPGQTLRVRVEDEAGNPDLWIHALTIPTLEEAVVGDWDTRFYDAEGSHTHSWEATWDADGTWEESRVEPALQLAGTWSIDGDRITTEITTAEPGDADPTTVDRRDESGFYVDETYFATWPLVRVDEGTGLEGTWTRAVKVWSNGDEGLVLNEDETHEITFAAGGVLTITREGIIDGAPDQVLVLGGTWVRVPNENYIENYGDYLVITLETLDGAPLDEPDAWVDLMVIRHDQLLLSPKVRAF
ncbi:MAG: hypothetical protein ABIK09_09020 [Pseudomonadota bacterium]